MDYIIRVYRYANKQRDHAYPVADIQMSDELRMSDIKFARKHGGDYIEIIRIDEGFDDYIYSY
jgi:hypothetical protein